jgi:hypothetical protein
MTIASKLLSAALVAILIAGCAAEQVAEGSKQGSAQPPDDLLLLPGAADVQRGTQYDGTLAYKLQERHPASDALATLDRRLKATNWREMKSDLFNPSGVSPLREWNVVEGEGRTVFTWKAYWENENGDVLLGIITYQVVKKGTELVPTPPAEIQFVRFSKATVLQLRAEIKKGETS